jgi:hypothetical protein
MFPENELPIIPANYQFTSKLLREKLSPEPSSNPPNFEHLHAWAESQNTPMVRQIAKKMVTNLNYISHQKFLTQLCATIADFDEKTNGAPYCLVIAENQYDKLFREGCSDTWVAGLALKHANLRKPEAILSLGDCHNHFLVNPNMKNVLILDDAAYSGQQKTKAMTHFFEVHRNYRLHRLNVYIGLVYQSNLAETKIKATDSTNSMTILEHGKIPSMMDAFNKREKEYLYASKLIIDGFHCDLSREMMARFKPEDIHQGLTLTYFDHTYPDFMSAYEPLYTGVNLLASTQHLKRLKEHMGESMSLDSFQDSVPHHNQSTGYTIPTIKRPYDRRPQVHTFFMSDRSTSASDYVKVNMTDEQQKAFDLRYVNEDAFLRIPTQKTVFNTTAYLTRNIFARPSRVELERESYGLQKLCNDLVPTHSV